MDILNKIQKELKAPKGQKNTFGNYNYRSCEDILEAVKPLLGHAVLTLNDEVVMIGDRFYIKATATLSDGTKSVFASAYAREAVEKKGMDVAQITGAASSYARKYALNGLFCIDDTKDADTTNNHNGGTIEYIDTKQQNQIADMLIDINASVDPFLKYLGVPSLDKLPKEKFQQAVEAINARAKKAGAK